MKKISLIAVILLLASVAGLAQNVRKTEVKTEVFDTVVFLPSQIQLNKNGGIVFDSTTIARIRNVPMFISQIRDVPVGTSVDVETVTTSSRFDRMLEELAQKEGVTAVTIAKSLLDIMPEIRSYVEESGVELKIVARLEHIDVFKSTNEDAKKNMRAINKVISRGTQKVLMRIKNESANIVFYGDSGENQKDGLKSIIMFSENQNECVLIRLLGTFNKEDIKQIININKKK